MRVIQPRKSLLGSARQRTAAAVLRCQEGPDNLTAKGFVIISCVTDNFFFARALLCCFVVFVSFHLMNFLITLKF